MITVWSTKIWRRPVCFVFMFIAWSLCALWILRWWCFVGAPRRRGRSWCFTENPATCRSWTPKNHARNPIGSFFFQLPSWKLVPKVLIVKYRKFTFWRPFQPRFDPYGCWFHHVSSPLFSVLSCSNSKRCRKTSPLCCITLTYFNLHCPFCWFILCFILAWDFEARGCHPAGNWATTVTVISFDRDLECR